MNFVKELDANFSEIGPLFLMFSDSIAYQQREVVAPKIKKFYVGDKPFDKSTKSKVSQVYIHM